LTGVWAWVGLRRRAVRLLPRPADTPRLRQARHLARVAGEGALAFGLMATGLAVIGLLFALVVVDGGWARLGLIVGFPVVGLSLGAALSDAALGAALAGIRGYSSLFHFGLPARPDSGAAPAWLMVALIVAPALVAATAWRRLERDRPADEQRALAIGAVTAAGFAGVGWPRGPLGGAGPQIVGHLGAGRLGAVGTVLVLRPNPASVLGLALLWSLAAGLGTAFAWAALHGVRWRGAPTAETGAPPATAGPPTPTSPPPPGRPAAATPTGGPGSAPATGGPPTPTSPPPPASAPPTGGRGAVRGGAGGGEAVGRPVFGVVFGVGPEDLAVDGVELDEAPLGGRLVGRVEEHPPDRAAAQAPPGQ